MVHDEEERYHQGEAITLADAPALHERLHNFNAQHQCAVTLVRAGSYDHAVAAPVLTQPDAAAVAGDITPPLCRFVSATVPCSILEHAPPAFS